MNELFKELFGLFPSSYGLFKNQENLDNTKINWLKAFKDHDLFQIAEEPNMIIFKECIKHCQTLDQPFMPSCGQFIAIYYITMIQLQA